MKPRILAVGSSNIDFVCCMPRTPQAGETITSDESYAFVPGGKGANAAVAAARLGADVVFCTRVGNDSYAAQLKSKYAAQGIDTRFVNVDKTAKTGLAVVMVENSGANRIIVYPGANALLSAQDVEDAFSCYPDALLIQCEIDSDTVIAAAKLAQRENAKIFFDAGPAKTDFPLEALPPVEIFSPNETETYTFTGIMPNSADNCLKACIALSSRVKAKYIVIKLGERGCFVYEDIYSRVVAVVETGTHVATT